MVNGYDIAYGLGLGLTAPVWLMVPKARRKVLKALAQRMGQVEPRVDTSAPTILIHAVSVGELNATPKLVAMLEEARPELRFVISTTSETGFARANQLYGKHERATVIRYPLDFSSAVQRTLDALRPVAVVLLELEVWPNFVRECRRRNVPVLVVNGRMTAVSFPRYKRAAPLTRRMFATLAAVCAQEQTYADRFIALGAVPDRVRVTGTMKFDTAQVADRIEGADELAAAVWLNPTSERIWVCGSTGPGEEEIVLDTYRSLRPTHPTLRLAIIPRHPERFGDVAKLIESAGFPVVRRSNPQPVPAGYPPSAPAVVLGDTMGELRKFYSLAEVVLVCRTLVDLGPSQHGSDMIEPAALAKPVIVGPFTGNFTEVMNAFRSASAMVEIAAPDELGDAVRRILSDRQAATSMGTSAQSVVRSQQGATARHVEAILAHLPQPS